MDDEFRKELFREELRKKNKGKKSVSCKYRPKYPVSAEREYLRMVNEYMAIEREILMKYIPEIKQILNEGTRECWQNLNSRFTRKEMNRDECITKLP